LLIVIGTLNPKDFNAYNNLGVIHQSLAEYKKAIQFYKKAVEIQPNYIDAYNNLGTLLVELNHLNDAKSIFEKSLNIDPNKKTFEGYGNLLLKLNQHNKALNYIKKGTGFIRFSQKEVKII